MKPELRIFQDSERLSRHAANLFIEESNKSIRGRNRFLVALNGGSTPTRLFQLLATEYRDQIDWSKVHVFWGDERCVPPDDSGSNFHQANELFLSKAPIPENNIHRVQGELDPATASKQYAETLKTFADSNLDFPRFDLVYLGMGEDGHVGSLFPGAAESATGRVAFVRQSPKPPAERLTLTRPMLASARRTILVATGEAKRVALERVLSADLALPATGLPSLVIVTDLDLRSGGLR